MSAFDNFHSMNMMVAMQDNSVSKLCLMRLVLPDPHPLIIDFVVTHGFQIPPSLSQHHVHGFTICSISDSRPPRNGEMMHNEEFLKGTMNDFRLKFHR